VHGPGRPVPAVVGDRNVAVPRATADRDALRWQGRVCTVVWQSGGLEAPRSLGDPGGPPTGMRRTSAGGDDSRGSGSS